MVNETIVEEVLDFVEVQLFFITDQFEFLLLLFLCKHVVRSSFLEYADLGDHQPQTSPASIEHVIVCEEL